MIVFIGGMQRSGSTFSFNIAREVLNQRGSVYQASVGSILEASSSAADTDHLLIKGHTADEFTLNIIKYGAARAICTIRKPEDAISSWMDTFGFSLDQSIEHILEWEIMFKSLKKYALVIDFSEIDQNPILAAGKIGRHLYSVHGYLQAVWAARKYTKQNVKKLSEEIERDIDRHVDIGFSQYDDKTFFHRRHITDIQTRNAVQRIGIDNVQYIRKRLRHIINENGDLLI